MEPEQQPAETPVTRGSLDPSDPVLFQRLEDYPWTSDSEFQSGLQAILGGSSEPQQVRELTLRARCFYYERKYAQSIDFDAYKGWYSAHSRVAGSNLPRNELPPSAEPSSAASQQASSLASTVNGDSSESQAPLAGQVETETLPAQPAPSPGFAEIMQMIQTGQPIPGIRDIPTTVLEGQGSSSSQTARPKPWESRSGSRSQGQLF